MSQQKNKTDETMKHTRERVIKLQNGQSQDKLAEKNNMSVVQSSSKKEQ